MPRVRPVMVVGLGIEPGKTRARDLDMRATGLVTAVACVVPRLGSGTAEQIWVRWPTPDEILLGIEPVEESCPTRISQ
jgi:hypothetical protein